MSPAALTLRDTYKWEHLWVVCSLPDERGAIVIINFTTRRTPSDDNCIIRPGEHPFVKHDTVMAYEKARILDTGAQKAIVSNPARCPPHVPVSPALLAKIQLGALKSDLTPQKIQAAIERSMQRQGKAVTASPFPPPPDLYTPSTRQDD